MVCWTKIYRLVIEKKRKKKKRKIKITKHTKWTLKATYGKAIVFFFCLEIFLGTIHTWKREKKKRKLNSINCFGAIGCSWFSLLKTCVQRHCVHLCVCVSVCVLVFFNVKKNKRKFYWRTHTHKTVLDHLKANWP